MHVKKDSKNLQSNIVHRVVKAAQSGAYQFDDDMEYLFPEEPLLEDLGDTASGAIDLMPRKTLRDRHYGPQPLIVRPEYSGDFLDKLRAQMYENKTAEESLIDFSNPEEMLKYIPVPVPRDLRDEFYEIGRPGPGAGYEDLKQYHDRGWDENDSPEMSEDKILRMRDWNKACPCFKKENKKPSLFHTAHDHSLVQVVIANYMLQTSPAEINIDLQQMKTAMLLKDFENTRIRTKMRGEFKPSISGVKISLAKAEPNRGRWTFTTGSKNYKTIFEFIPKGSTKDLNALDVRVSCSCPAWVYWGCQFNAFTKEYLYGPVRLKVTPPNKRDPEKKSLVCKHILACIPMVSRYKLYRGITPEIRERLTRTPKTVVDVSDFKEKIKIPPELKQVANRPDIKKFVRDWPRLLDNDRRKIIMNLDSPEAVTFMAHRFPETASAFVVDKLKDIATHGKDASIRTKARELMSSLIG